MHPRGQCGILRTLPYYREQRSVRFGWNLGHAEQAQVSYYNYSFVGEQGHPRTVGKYCVNMIEKKRCMIFDSGMMTQEESHVLRWLKNGTLW